MVQRFTLTGHEHPHAIQINHLRDSISSIGSVSEIDAAAFPENEEITQPDVRNRCQFVLRSSRQSPNKWLSGDHFVEIVYCHVYLTYLFYSSHS